MKSSPSTEKSKNTEKQAENTKDGKSVSNDDSAPLQKRQTRMRSCRKWWRTRFIWLLKLLGLGSLLVLVFIAAASLYIMADTTIGSDSTAIQQKNKEKFSSNSWKLMWQSSPTSKKTENTNNKKIEQIRTDINAMRRAIIENAATTENTNNKKIEQIRTDINAMRRAIIENAATTENTNNKKIEQIRTDINAMRRVIKENSAITENTNNKKIEQIRTDINAMRRVIKENSAITENTNNGREIEQIRTDINAMRRVIKENSAITENTNNGKDAILMIAMNGLDRAIQNGDPYAGELELLVSITPDAQGIDQLRSYAHSGITTREKLRVSFTDMAFVIIAAGKKTQKDKQTVIEQIFNKSLTDIIRIRTLKYQGGEKVEDIVAHVEEYLNNDNLASAVTEARKLNRPHMQDMVQSWIVEAELRLKIERLLKNLRHDTLSKLGQLTVTQTK